MEEVIDEAICRVVDFIRKTVEPSTLEGPVDMLPPPISGSMKPDPARDGRHRVHTHHRLELCGVNAECDPKSDQAGSDDSDCPPKAERKGRRSTVLVEPDSSKRGEDGGGDVLLPAKGLQPC